MDKYQKAIHRYESARQLTSALKFKRSKLINECEHIDTIDDPRGYGKVEIGTLCLTSVFNELMDTIEMNGPGYSYEETMENMHCEERCCDKCYESYQIKIGPLAEAKKEFGNAKRALSYVGKKLIESNE